MGGSNRRNSGGIRRKEALWSHFALIDAVDGEKKPFTSGQETFMEQFCFIKSFRERKKKHCGHEGGQMI